MNGHLFTDFRGEVHCDGGLTNFIPIPPGTVGVRVCCFPSKQVGGFAVVVPGLVSTCVRTHACSDAGNRQCWDCSDVASTKPSHHLLHPSSMQLSPVFRIGISPDSFEPW